MAEHFNPGKVNIEKMVEGIKNTKGGEVVSKQKGDVIHSTAYIRTEKNRDDTSQNPPDRRVSWDTHPDGRVTDVHLSVNGHPRTEYGNK